jgi:hypothetical protein
LEEYNLFGILSYWKETPNKSFTLLRISSN